MRKWNKILSTWFGLGLLPYAPGTAGSLGALPLCWFCSSHLSLPHRFLVALLVTALAVLSAKIDQTGDGGRSDHIVHDPQYIVIDEVSGMLWTLIFAPPTWLAMLGGFILFRIFDIVKPFPANKFDQSSFSLPTPLGRAIGIVFDDVVAGLYSAACLEFLLLAPDLLMR